MSLLATPWYRDRAALAFIGLRYLPLLAGFDLAWELAQLPLYSIWREGNAGYIAFAVAHCTIGDLLVGTAALAFALAVTSGGPLASWRWRTIAVLATLAGAAYTATSEWLNTARHAWQYAELMPKLQLGDGAVGLSPLAQWIIVPPLALWIARRIDP